MASYAGETTRQFGIRDRKNVLLDHHPIFTNVCRFQSLVRIDKKKENELLVF